MSIRLICPLTRLFIQCNVFQSKYTIRWKWCISSIKNEPKHKINTQKEGKCIVRIIFSWIIKLWRIFGVFFFFFVAHRNIFFSAEKCLQNCVHIFGMVTRYIKRVTILIVWNWFMLHWRIRQQQNTNSLIVKLLKLFLYFFLSHFYASLISFFSFKSFNKL